MLREIADDASANICDYLEIDHTGKVKPNLSMLTGDSAKGLAEYSVTKDGFRIKLTVRLKALELLCKHLGLFVERHEHDFGDPDLYVQLAAVMGLDRACDKELQEAAVALEESDEEPQPQ